MKRQRSLTCFTLGYAQVAVIFPLVVVSPRYFWKQTGWGGLMQVVNAFSFVQNSLSFIINSYTDIAAWQAVTQRLNDFEELLLAIRQSTRAPRQIVVRREDFGVTVKEIDLDLPDGTPLLRGVTFASRRGEAVLSLARPAWEEYIAAGNRWDLAVRPRRNQARQRANPLRSATALSTARHSRRRTSLSAHRFRQVADG